LQWDAIKFPYGYSNSTLLQSLNCLLDSGKYSLAGFNILYFFNNAGGQRRLRLLLHVR
jgi:hypothetical protein